MLLLESTVHKTTLCTVSVVVLHKTTLCNTCSSKIKKSFFFTSKHDMNLETSIVHLKYLEALNYPTHNLFRHYFVCFCNICYNGIHHN